MRLILVCGGRHYTDAWAIEQELLSFCDDERRPDTDVTIMHGDAPGADRLAGEVATALGFPVFPVPADWEGPCCDTCKKGHRRISRTGRSYCPAAGVYRNERMLGYGPAMVIAMPGGKGTAHMLEIAKAAGVDWIAPGWRASRG
jgi:hypothetical protein